MASADFTKSTHFIEEVSSQAITSRHHSLFSATDDNGGLLAWLSTLEKTSAQLGQQLQQNVAHHANTSFIPAYKYNDQLYQRGAGQLEEACSSSNLFLGSANELKAQATTASSDTHFLETQTGRTHSIVSILKKLVHVSSELDQVAVFLGQGAIVDSTRQLLKVLEILACEDDQNVTDVNAWYQLRTKAERYKSLLANAIHDGLTQGVLVVGCDSEGDQQAGMELELQVRHSIPFTHETMKTTTLYVKDLMLASAMLQTQHVELASIKRRLVKQFFTPFLSDDLENQCKHGLVHLSVDEDSSTSVPSLRLTITHHNPEDDGGSTEEPFESHHTKKCAFARSRMDQCFVMIRFLFDHLFGAEPYWLDLRQLFGRLLLPDVFSLLITTTIAPTVPSSSTSTTVLDNLSTLASSVTSFEQRCIVEYAGIQSKVPATNNSTDADFPLGLYVRRFDHHLAHKRRAKLLQDARSIMLRRIYDAEPVSSGLFITQTPRVLCAMIQDMATEVQALDQPKYRQHFPKTILSLQKSMHDCLVLYMSIMPSIHRTEFLHHSDRAIVFRNDCYWLAEQQQQDEAVGHKLRELGNFWQSVVGAQLMNLAVAILNKTEEWQHEHDGGIQQQQGMVSMQSPTMDHHALPSQQPQQPQQQQQQQQQQGMSLEEAITAIVTRVEDMAATLRPVTSPDLHKEILVDLVDKIVDRLSSDILSMSDISAEASRTMAQALNGIAQLANVFLTESNQAVISEFTLRQWIPHWQRFWMVKEMLDMTMVDILETLHRGDLAIFTHHQLIHLVCALFADTPRRDETIRTIKTSDLNGTPRELTTVASPSPPSSHSPAPSSSQRLDSGTTSRFTFDIDEADDGWNQDGWFDEDDQGSLEINPPSHPNHASDHGGWSDEDDRASFEISLPSHTNHTSDHDTPRQSETLGTATTSDSDGPPLASTAAIPPPVSTLSPTVSPSSSQPMDLASRFAFNLDEADDGWNQDGWFDEDDQASLEITPSSHTNYTSDHDTLGRDETLSTVETSDLNGPPIESPSTTCPPNPPTASLSLSQPLDHGIASRFAFNEADDGWNQDGWFDEDEQANTLMTQETHSPEQGTQAFLDQDAKSDRGTPAASDGTTGLSSSSLLLQHQDDLALDDDMDGWSDADRVVELELQRELAPETRDEKDGGSPDSESVRRG